MNATMTAPPVSMHASTVPDPEVPERPMRRRFSAEYKLRLLAETDAAPFGQVAAILRREGLYSSHLESFRKQRDAGALIDGASPTRGPKRNPFTTENAKLRRENDRLRKELEKARFVIDVQKKVAKLLGIPDPTDEESP
jgi:transposase-like protein